MNRVLMWEVRAAPGCLDALVAVIRSAASPEASIYSSGDPDERVVVIDPTGQGPGEVPAELIARPPHQWIFDVVER